MPLVQAVFFMLADDSEPVGCSVDNATKLKVEVIMQSQYGSSPEEINNMLVVVADAATGNAIRCFDWNGLCALRGGVTYTIDTPIFGPLPTGKYIIKRAFGYGPLTKTLAECGINLGEIPCA